MIRVFAILVLMTLGLQACGDSSSNSTAFSANSTDSIQGVWNLTQLNDAVVPESNSVSIQIVSSDPTSGQLSTACSGNIQVSQDSNGRLHLLNTSSTGCFIEFTHDALVVRQQVQDLLSQPDGLEFKKVDDSTLTLSNSQGTLTFKLGL